MVRDACRYGCAIGRWSSLVVQAALALVAVLLLPFFAMGEGEAEDGQGGGVVVKPVCPQPGEVVDQTNDSEAIIGVDLSPVGLKPEIWVVRGPTTIRQESQPDSTVQTEILSMSLSGSSPSLGQVRVQTSRNSQLRSRGLMRGLKPVPDGIGGEECVAADVFFDVFVEVEVSELELTAGNLSEPVRMRGQGIPVRHTRPFELNQELQPGQQGVAMLDPTGRLIGFITSTQHTVEGGGGGEPVCPCYPRAGIDEMNSTLLHDIDVPGFGLCRANLGGPVKVRRTDPYTDPTTGLCCIDTEIVEMQLEGSDPICGRISVTLDPCRPSKGQICEKVPQTCFPANSWFNVFVKVELKDLGMCLYACQPAKMHCMIDRIPPFRCLYNLDVGTTGTVPLYRGPCDIQPDECDSLNPCNQSPLPEPAATIVKAVHQPLPPEQCDCYPEAGEDVLQTTLGHGIDLPGLNVTCTDFQGAMVVGRSDPYINAAGLCCIDTEIKRLEMTGTCSNGLPAKVTLCPDRPSKGFICEQEPGTCFPANSCFDVFFILEVAMPDGTTMGFKNCKPATMCCKFARLPPLGCPYELQNAPVPLYKVVPGTVSSPCRLDPLPPPDGTLENASHVPEEEVPPCCPEYGPGTDTFHSTLLHNIDIPGIGLCEANLKGPVKVNRGKPYRDPLTGLCCVEVEMVDMRLQGIDPLCGEVSITLDPRRPSRGRICEKEPGACFPANSCFEVHVRIEVKDHGIVLVPCKPARMCCMIDSLPPFGCLYNLDLGDGDVVPLYEEPTSAATGGGAGRNTCVVADDGTGTVDLPPANCSYLSPDDVHMIIDGLPAGTTINVGVEHTKFFNVQRRTDPNLPGGEIEIFDSLLLMDMQGSGDLASFQRNIVMQVACEVHTGPRAVGDPVQTFPNEMVRLEGQLFGDPDFDQLKVVGGTANGLPSPGETTLTRLPGGDFQVDSFFDIDYQIEFQGAPGSILEGLGGTTQDTVRMSTGGGGGGVPTDPDPCKQVPLPAPRALLLKVGSDGTTQTVHRPDPPRLPPGDTDELETEAEVEVCLFGLGPDGDDALVSASLSGPVAVRRGDPQVQTDGTETVDTELLSMNLTGVFDPANFAGKPPPEWWKINIGLSSDPDLRSLGTIRALVADAEKPVRMFQVDSFFDVFVDVSLEDSVGKPVLVATSGRTRMQAADPSIFGFNPQPKPPGDGAVGGGATLGLKPVDFTIPPFNIPFVLDLSAVPLYQAGNPDPVGQIKTVVHIPRNPCDQCPEYGPGMDVMQSSLLHKIVFPGMIDPLTGEEKMCGTPLRGKVKVSRGKPYVNRDGLCCVTTRMLELDLSGDDPACGPVRIGVCPDRISRGFICQKPDVAPACFPAQSCFLVFVEVEVMGMVLKNCEPVEMCCMVDSLPPYSCSYEIRIADPSGIPLYRKGDCDDPNRQPVALITNDSVHIPEPCEPLDLQCRTVVSPDQGVAAVQLSWQGDPDCEGCERFMLTRTNPDGTQTAFTLPGTQTTFVDDLTGVDCPPGTTIALEYCIQCVIRGAVSERVCCAVTIECGTKPCEVRGVTCSRSGDEIIIAWQTDPGSFRLGCCDSFRILKNGAVIREVGPDLPAPQPGEVPTFSVTVPCMPGEYCVQCVQNGVALPITDRSQQCCRIDKCPCAITQVKCSVDAAAQGAVISWQTDPMRCCDDIRILMDGQAIMSVPGDQNSVTVDCPPGRHTFCVQCVRDGVAQPIDPVVHCCEVICGECEIDGPNCDVTDNGIFLNWTLGPACVCEEIFIRVLDEDGNVARQEPASNLGSHSFMGRCMDILGGRKGRICVVCVQPDGTEIVACCDVECPCDDENAIIADLRCVVDDAANVVTISWSVPDPDCCTGVVITDPNGQTTNVPAGAQSFTLDCQEGEYCVQCIKPDSTPGPKECCDVECRRPCEFDAVNCRVTPQGIQLEWMYVDPDCRCERLEIQTSDGLPLLEVDPGAVGALIPGDCNEILGGPRGEICIVCIDASGNVVARICCEVECPGRQLPCDCNQDGTVDISDGVCLLSHLFLGIPPELPCGDGKPTHPSNILLMSCNGDGTVDLSDAIYLFVFLFLGGPPPVQGTDCIVVPDCPDICVRTSE